MKNSTVMSKSLSFLFGTALVLPLTILACDGEVGDATDGVTSNGDNNTNGNSSTSGMTGEPTSTTGEPATTTGTCEDQNVPCTCNIDSDCPDGQVCTPDGLCVGEDPSTTGDPMTTTGNPNTTGNDLCNSDDECPPGMMCVNGVCDGDPDTTTGEPSTTGDPMTGTDTNGCTDPNLPCCESDSDCAPGQLCIDGVCTGEGMTTGDPGVCGNGIVEPGEECDDGNDNPNDGCDSCMLNGLCNNPNDPDCCNSDDECPPDQICVMGTCTGNFLQCEADSDCPPMMQCVNGLCQ